MAQMSQLISMKQKQMRRCREQIVAEGQGKERDELRLWHYRCKLLHSEWMKQKVLQGTASNLLR